MDEFGPVEAVPPSYSSIEDHGVETGDLDLLEGHEVVILAATR